MSTNSDRHLLVYQGTTRRNLTSIEARGESDGRIACVTDPTDPQDVATKAYVDAAVEDVVAVTFTDSSIVLALLFE